MLPHDRANFKIITKLFMTNYFADWFPELQSIPKVMNKDKGVSLKNSSKIVNKDVVRTSWYWRSCFVIIMMLILFTLNSSTLSSYVFLPNFKHTYMLVGSTRQNILIDMWQCCFNEKNFLEKYLFIYII